MNWPEIFERADKDAQGNTGQLQGIRLGRRMVLTALLGALLTGLSWSVAASPKMSPWQGRVTHVTDGDTLWVQPDHGGAPRKIRLVGIDAPEVCQTHGDVSREVLERHVLGKPVLVAARRRDDYGRLLARISLRGEDIGAWMVAQGHAWSYQYRHDAGPYAAQEAQARAHGKGLFVASGAERPRSFRQRHGSCH